MKRYISLFLMLAGCNFTTPINANVNVKQSDATTAKTKSSAQEVSQLATKTPPAGAKSTGTKSRPQAGQVTIPVTNVEIYTFQSNIDQDADLETLFWAVSGDNIYLWGKIGIQCVNEVGNATGEFGDADFVFVATPDGYGWFTGTGACGYTTQFGCAVTNGAEICGGCDFTNQAIACVAAAQTTTEVPADTTPPEGE